jgi:hypothetical protein
MMRFATAALFSVMVAGAANASQSNRTTETISATGRAVVGEQFQPPSFGRDQALQYNTDNGA